MRELVVRPVGQAEYLAFFARHPLASFMQTPAWAAVKSEWGHDLLGWFDGEQIVAAGLVLYRYLARGRYCLAYFPEGPLAQWDGDQAELFPPLARYMKKRGAFCLRIGPTCVWRRWFTETVKQAIADPSVERLSDVPPDVVEEKGLALTAYLRANGWRPQQALGGFASGQPSFNFWLPLADKSESDLLAGMNQLWRRNIKKADKLGVSVRQGNREDLPRFHKLYVETAARDGFHPRPAAYFDQMWDALRGEDPDRIRVYLAEDGDDLLAATLWVKAGRHVWYSYGASSTAKREMRGSNAIQWQMIRDALAAGAELYDFRGIVDEIGTDSPETGILQFKVGAGGQAIEYVGEWDLPFNRVLYRLFQIYTNRHKLLSQAKNRLRSFGRQKER